MGSEVELFFLGLLIEINRVLDPTGNKLKQESPPA